MNGQNIRKILFQTVGTGGPSNPVWQALAFAVQERRPDLLVQWCTGESTQKTVPLFQEVLGEVDWPLEKQRLVHDQPDELESLALDYLADVDKLRKQYPDAEMEVDFTSGTKPMSAAAVAVAVARRASEVHYAVGPRDETGRAIRTDRLVSLNTVNLIADPLLMELGRLFNLGQFRAVAKQAHSLLEKLSEPLLRARAESLAFLAEVYELWDRFCWKEAFARLRIWQKKENDTQCFSQAGWDTEVLSEQPRHLKMCKDNRNIRYQRLADLLANVDRRLARSQYDDALARLYRLVELIGQLRFRKVFAISKHENPTGKVPLEQLAAKAPTLAEELKDRAQEGTVDLGVRNTLRALAEAGDQLGTELHRRYEGDASSDQPPRGPLGGLLDQRNQTFLAHGNTPAKREDTEALRTQVAEILDMYLRQAENLSLAEAMRSAEFLRCPWVEDNASGSRTS